MEGIVAGRPRAATLRASIQETMKRNRGERPFLLRSPLMDFLFPYERGRIVNAEVRKAIVGLANMNSRSGVYGALLIELEKRPSACLKAIRDLRKLWEKDANYANAVLDVLRHIRGPRAYDIVKWLADNGPRETRDKAEQLTWKGRNNF